MRRPSARVAGPRVCQSALWKITQEPAGQHTWTAPGKGVEPAERFRRGLEVGLVRAGHHHQVALVRQRHVGQEVADLQLQHRYPRPQVAEAVVGAVDVPARGSGVRPLFPERVGGVEVGFVLVEQGANVGYHRRMVGQVQEQRIIRQQVEDARAARMLLTRPREVRRTAPLQLPAPRVRPPQRLAQPSHVLGTEKRLDHQVPVGLEGVTLFRAWIRTHGRSRSRR